MSDPNEHDNPPPYTEPFLNADLTRAPGFVDEHKLWLIQRQLQQGPDILHIPGPSVSERLRRFSEGLDLPPKGVLSLTVSAEDVLTVVEAAEAHSEQMYCQQTGHDQKIHHAIARLLAPHTPEQLRLSVRRGETVSLE